MSETQARDQLRSITRFKVTKGQYLLAVIAFAAIIGLGISSIIASRATVDNAQVLSNIESPAASIIFTQRETLVYATRLAQWSNGGVSRRDVQIARSLLAQRLAVIDSSGKSVGSRARTQYWSLLRASDAIVASAPLGVLPERLHSRYSSEVAPVINQILAEARRLVVSYQRSIDREMLVSAQRTASRNQLNLALFYIFFISASLFLIFNVRTNFRNYRYAKKVLEVEQKRLDETIEELKRTQTTVAELQDLNQAKNSFISTVNHELRTPLTSIIGYLDVIRDEHLDDENEHMRSYLDVLDRNAQILLNLVESMLSLSRIDAEDGLAADDEVSLNEVIDNAIFVMRPAIEKLNLDVHFTADDERRVKGDFAQLSQVVINLLGNAIKFSPQRSQVNINLDSNRNSVGESFARISITDQGIGIPQEDIEKLFTRFFRARNAESGQYPGTGLGLSIVQQVVALHKGFINVASHVGQGTTFTVEIPLLLTSEEQMIFNRRGAVLSRAIASLESASPVSIKSVTHDIGGAIGLYGFEDEGAQILDFSRSLPTDPVPLDKFTHEKARLLQLLHIAEQRIGGVLIG